MATAAAAESTDSTRYFILLRQPAPGRDTWEAGSLWVETARVGDGRELQLGRFVPGDDGTGDSLRVACSNVSQLTTEMLYLLVAVRDSQERLMVFGDATWFREGVELHEGDYVHVTQQRRRLAGILRYKGATPKSPGTWFGVELTDKYAGEGTTDGVFQNERFFVCGEDCAVFVSLSKIRRRQGDDDDEDVGDTPTTKLALSERVVWLDDNGRCCNATVRWFGYLPEEMGYELIAGVEFDEPVGKGTGRFRGRHIFHTRKSHASLIPISGLIREGVMSSDDATYDGNAVAKKPDIVNAHVEQEPSATDNYDRLLMIGSRVEVLQRRGVIRWIGELQEGGRRIAGLEMDDEDPRCYTRGTFGDRQIFPCDEYRAFFVSLQKCRPDRQTVDLRSRGTRQLSVTGSFCGRRRGIHGSASSSHMDVVLFAMFAFRGLFDNLLDRSSVACSQLLKDVANLLCTQYYVNIDVATKLHQALNEISPSVCLDRQEPDPSQFFSFVCRDVLKAAPFVKLSTAGQAEYVYQLVSTGNAEAKDPPTVQSLFEESLLQHDAKLCSVIAPLVMRMPPGGNDTPRRRVFPTPHLDISTLLAGPEGATSERGPLLELFAVVTVEDQRCRSYVRPAEGSRLSWLLFETAPDSVGAEAEASVPVVRQCPDIVEWLSEERRQSVVNQASDVPSEICDIVTNASLCFYRFLEDKQPVYLSLIP